MTVPFGRKDRYSFGEAAPPPKYKKRRRIDPNEDLKAIKQVIKDLPEQGVTLEDFVLLVSPHTGDKGATLNKVMAEDIAAFQKMVIQIYNTMSQDVSDVLANEQIDLARMYAEKQRICLHRMERALQEIHDISPNFDFREYFKEPEKYLASLFKIADMPDDEEIETARRQLTYHRLQWLQSEGERLQAENTKLQNHLKELKMIQRDEIVTMVKKEQEEEMKKAELERQQAEMQSKLEELNNKLHKTIVGGEKKKMAAKKREESQALKKGRPSAKGRPSIKERPLWQGPKEDTEWSVQAAGALEETTIQASQVTIKSAGRPSVGSRPGTSRLSTGRTTLPPASRLSAGPGEETGAIRKRPTTKKKKTAIKDRPVWQDVDPREFGVDTAAATEAPSEIFKPPPQRRSPPRKQTSGCSESCSSAKPALPPARKSRAPRDSWGGFY